VVDLGPGHPPHHRYEGLPNYHRTYAHA
jgi:hypothetical protein